MCKFIQNGRGGETGLQVYGSIVLSSAQVTAAADLARSTADGDEWAKVTGVAYGLGSGNWEGRWVSLVSWTYNLALSLNFD
jgi:hypothetical protein